jgi:hypothetical protein
MRTSLLTLLFLSGFSLGLIWIHYLQIPTPAHAMTFNERAGHMFDSVKPEKGDRLAPAYDLKGGALVDGNSVHALIFRSTGHAEAPPH